MDSTSNGSIPAFATSERTCKLALNSFPKTHMWDHVGISEMLMCTEKNENGSWLEQTLISNSAIWRAALLLPCGSESVRLVRYSFFNKAAHLSFAATTAYHSSHSSSAAAERIFLKNLELGQSKMTFPVSLSVSPLLGHQ